MMTASFFTYSGPGRVSIARAAPRGMSGFRVYRKLAPGPWFRSVPPAEYAERFMAEILTPLDPAEVVAELQMLAGDAEPVMLCWERPPFTAPDDWHLREGPHEMTNWCHRRMVAIWLRDRLGLEVPELEPGPSRRHHREGFVYKKDSPGRRRGR